MKTCKSCIHWQHPGQDDFDAEKLCNPIDPDTCGRRPRLSVTTFRCAFGIRRNQYGHWTFDHYDSGHAASHIYRSALRGVAIWQFWDFMSCWLARGRNRNTLRQLVRGKLTHPWEDS